MISSAQLSVIRMQSARVIEEVFGVEIEIGGHVIPAARHRSSVGGTNELAGVLPTADAMWRVRREVLPSGLEIKPERTTVREGNTRFRVESVRDPAGDPCIVIMGRAI